jgi:hypothetical protein
VRRGAGRTRGTRAAWRLLSAVRKLRGNLQPSLLTSRKVEAYIAPTTARRPLIRRDDAPAKLLTFGVTKRRFRSAALSFGGSPAYRGGDRHDPGLFDK